MRRFLLLSIGIFALGLSGCTTISNVASDLGDDLEQTFSVSNDAVPDEPVKADSAEALIAADHFNKNCPQVIVVDELSSLSEFSDISAPKDYNLMSRVQMQAASSNCIYSVGTVRADVKLVFESVLGQRGKAQSGDRPFVSYPFFVAVTDQNDNILAKEVFAASMTYERNETRHTYYENLRQIIPISTRSDGPNYKIMVGFQLTDDQLAYNRATMVKPVTVEAPAPAPATEQAPEEPQEQGEIIDIIKQPPPSE